MDARNGTTPCHVDTLQEKLIEVNASVQGSKDDANKELDVLWQKVKTAAALLTYLKSKVKVMPLLGLAQKSCGSQKLEGVGLVNEDGVPVSSWSKDVDLSSFHTTDEEDTSSKLSIQQDNCDKIDEAYIGEMLKSIDMVPDVMETLVKRVILAELETAMEKEKVSICQEEIRNKAIQIDDMSSKLEKMEDFAFGTKAIMEDMQQRMENLVEEIYTQTQRTKENEQELSRVKRNFESLKSYVSSLISVRETLLHSEKQFQTIERLFKRLVAKTTQLEGEKAHKENEVQKLMEENVRLAALLDKKEAQLSAMNKQCKI